MLVKLTENYKPIDRRHIPDVGPVPAGTVIDVDGEELRSLLEDGIAVPALDKPRASEYRVVRAIV